MFTLLVFFNIVSALLWVTTLFSEEVASALHRLKASGYGMYSFRSTGIKIVGTVCCRKFNGQPIFLY